MHSHKRRDLSPPHKGGDSASTHVGSETIVEEPMGIQGVVSREDMGGRTVGADPERDGDKRV